MAKFKRGNLQLKTDQKIELGDNQESIIQFDGSKLDIATNDTFSLSFDIGGSTKFSLDSDGMKLENGSVYVNQILSIADADNISSFSTDNQLASAKTIYEQYKGLDAAQNGTSTYMYYTDAQGQIAATQHMTFDHSDNTITLGVSTDTRIIATQTSHRIELYVQNSRRFDLLPNGFVLGQNGVNNFQIDTDNGTCSLVMDSNQTMSSNPSAGIQLIMGRSTESHIEIKSLESGETGDIFIESEDIITIDGAGGVELHDNGTKVFETDSTGIVVTGDITCNDLYASGSTIHVGTGEIKSTAGNVELYYAASKTFETISGGMSLTDGVSSSEFYHSSGELLIKNLQNSGNTQFRSRESGGAERIMMNFVPANDPKVYLYAGSGVSVFFTKDDGSSGGFALTRGSSNFVDFLVNSNTKELFITNNQTGGVIELDAELGVRLFHNSAQVFETDSTGVIVTGDITCDDLFVSGDTIHVGTGEIKSTAGNVELYYDGTKKFETTSYGADVIGDLDVSGVVKRGVNVEKIYGDSTAIDGDILVADTTSEITVTLIESVNAKIVVKTLNDHVIVQGESGTIDDEAEVELSQQYWSMTFVCDGTDWFII